MSIARRRFLGLLGSTIGSGFVVAALPSCGGGDSNTVDAPKNGCTVMIAANHVHAPHALVVPMEDVTAGAEKVYDIMGTAPHTHTITVTADMMTMLKAGGTMVMVTSTEAEQHTHVVTITC